VPTQTPKGIVLVVGVWGLTFTGDLSRPSSRKWRLLRIADEKSVVPDGLAYNLGCNIRGVPFGLLGFVSKCQVTLFAVEYENSYDGRSIIGLHQMAQTPPRWWIKGMESRLKFFKWHRKGGDHDCSIFTRHSFSYL
jgi:hypothetical protein